MLYISSVNQFSCWIFTSNSRNCLEYDLFLFVNLPHLLCGHNGFHLPNNVLNCPIADCVTERRTEMRNAKISFFAIISVRLVPSARVAMLVRLILKISVSKSQIIIQLIHKPPWIFCGLFTFLESGHCFLARTSSCDILFCKISS